jgi:SHS2 domain-containing protein
MLSRKPYRVFDHTADLGVEIFAKTKEELYTHAAFSVFDLMADLKDVSPRETRKIAVDGTDPEDLLVNYLREVLYLFNGKRLLLQAFLIDTLNDHHLSGTVEGDFFDPARHHLKREIKAVTYHNLQILETPEGWRGRVIFDV